MHQQTDLGKGKLRAIRLRWERFIQELPASRQADIRRVTRIAAVVASVLCVLGLAQWLLPGPASVLVFIVLFGSLLLAARSGLLERWIDAAAKEGQGRREKSSPELSVKHSRPALKLNKEQFEEQLKNQVIGQEEAIQVLVRQVRGKLASQTSKPLVLLLPGPTGTGKTELAKATANALGVKLERFDMGEFASEFTASNLFGSPRGYIGSPQGGALPNALRRSRTASVCVMLFDEVEKAHRSIWPMLLSFFDEGRAGDNQGTAIAPKNMIILMTSNLAAEAVGDTPEKAKEILQRTGYFPQEFLGRVNKVIPLKRLSAQDNERLIQRLLGRLGREYGMRISLDRSAMDALVAATRAEARSYGGRGILEKLSDLLIDDLIDLQDRGIKTVSLSGSKTSAGVVVNGSGGRATA